MMRGSHNTLLKSEGTHNLGPNCLVHRLKNVSMDSSLRFAAQPSMYFSSRAKQTRIRDDNKLREEDLTPGQAANVKSILNDFLAPSIFPGFRCAACTKCITCAPLKLLTKPQRLQLAKERENPDILNNVKIIPDPTKPGKLSQVKLSCQPTSYTSRAPPTSGK